MNGAWFDGAMVCAGFSLVCLALMIGIEMKRHHRPNATLSAIRQQRLAVLRARLLASNVVAVIGLAGTVYIGCTAGLGHAIAVFVVLCIVVSLMVGDLLHKVHEI